MGLRFRRVISNVIILAATAGIVSLLTGNAHAATGLCGLIFERDKVEQTETADASRVGNRTMPNRAMASETVASSPAQTSRFTFAPTRTCEFPPQYQTAANAAY